MRELWFSRQLLRRNWGLEIRAHHFFDTDLNRVSDLTGRWGKIWPSKETLPPINFADCEFRFSDLGFFLIGSTNKNGRILNLKMEFTVSRINWRQWFLTWSDFTSSPSQITNSIQIRIKIMVCPYLQPQFRRNHTLENPSSRISSWLYLYNPAYLMVDTVYSISRSNFEGKFPLCLDPLVLSDNIPTKLRELLLEKISCRWYSLVVGIIYLDSTPLITTLRPILFVIQLRMN